MKLSLDNGTVVCSLDNKNREFLSACAGLWDGFLNGKLKLYSDKPKEWRVPEAAQKSNAERLKTIIALAGRYGIEIDDTVSGYNLCLQSDAEQIRARNRADEEAQKQSELWGRLCKNGCGKCRYLAYQIDVPKCIKTGKLLEERNVQRYVGGVLHLFNLEPFPSSECPFNINKNKE